MYPLLGTLESQLYRVANFSVFGLPVYGTARFLFCLFLVFHFPEIWNISWPIWHSFQNFRAHQGAKMVSTVPSAHTCDGNPCLRSLMTRYTDHRFQFTALLDFQVNLSVFLSPLTGSLFSVSCEHHGSLGWRKLTLGGTSACVASVIPGAKDVLSSSVFLWNSSDLEWLSCD